MSQFLKFGQYLTLSGTHTTVHMNNLNKEVQQGLLSVQGHLFDFLTVQQVNPTILDPNIQCSQEVLQIKNYNEMVFQIIPKLNFQCEKQYQKLKNQMQKIKKENKMISKENKSNESDQNYLDLQKQLNDLNKKVIMEQQTNDRIIQHVFGTNLTYGQEFMLKHMESGLFLNGSPQVCKATWSAYCLNLQKASAFNHQQFSIIFQIHPKFKLSTYGDPIQYEDQVYIYNVKQKNYINFDPNISIHEKQDKEYDYTKFSYKFMKLQKEQSQTIINQAYLNLSKYIDWRPHFYSECVNIIDQTIYCGQLIKLKHVEVNGYLAADVNYESIYQEIYLYKNMIIEQFMEEENVNQLWIVETNINKNRGVPVSEKQNIPNYYRLRHYFTGKLLILKKYENNEGNMVETLVLQNDDDEFDNNSVIQFQSSMKSKQTKSVQNKEYYFFSVDDNYIEYKNDQQYYLTSQECEQVENINETQIDFQQDNFSIENKGLKIKKLKIQMSSNKRLENIFQMVRIDDEIRSNIALIRSSYQTLTKLINIFQMRNEKMISNEIILSVTQVLRELMAFVLKTGELDDNPSEIEGIPIPERQKLLKDMKIIELLTQILQLPFAYGILDIQNLNDINPRLLIILKYCNRLISLIIKDYSPNELYASQWLNLFQKLTMLAKGENNIQAYKTLIELIDKNQFIIETKLPRNILERLIQQVYQKQDPNIIKILQAALLCNETTMFNNQQIVSKILFKQRDVDQLIFPIKRSSKLIMVYEKWMSIKEFNQASQRIDNGTKFQYFYELINMFAMLCRDRNYWAINKLEILYPYDLCLYIVNDQSSSLNLRRSFVNLISSLWINRNPQIVNILPYQIRIVDELQNSEEKFIDSQNDQSKFDSLIQFVENYLKVHSGVIDNSFVAENLLTSSILTQCQSLFKFGFYNTQEKINGIIPCLINILNGCSDKISSSSNEINHDHQNSISVTVDNMIEKNVQNRKRFEVNSDNEIVHKIKIEILKIFKLMLIIRDEQRVSSFLKYAIDLQNQKPIEKKKTRRGTEILIQVDEKSSKILEKIQSICSKLQLFQTLSESINLQKDDEMLQGILSDCLAYQNKELQNSVIEFQSYLYFQQFQLMQLIEGVQIIDNQNMKNILAECISLKNEFVTYSEKTEEWLVETQGLDPEIKLQNQYIEIRVIEILSRFLELIVKPVKSGFEIQKEIQKLMMNLELSKPLIQLLMFHKIMIKQMHDEGRNDYLLEEQQNKIIILDYLLLSYLAKEKQIYKDIMIKNNNNLDDGKYILKNCTYFDLYVFDSQSLQILHILLSLFVVSIQYFNNIQNLLQIYLVFLQHLILQPQVQANILLSNLIEDNHSIIDNAEQSYKLIQFLYFGCKQLSFDDPSKGTFLLSINQLIQLNSQPSKTNQKMIISFILQNGYENFLIDFNKEQADILQQNIKKFEEDCQKIGSVVMIPVEVTYFCLQLLLLCNTTAGINGYTEQECAKIFSQEFIFEKLQIFKSIYYVKRNLLLYFYNVFLDTERVSALNLNVMEQIVHMLIQDLSDINAQLSKKEQDIKLKTYHGTFSIREIQIDYIYNSIIPTFHEVSCKLSFYLTHSQMKMLLSPLIEQLAFQMKFYFHHEKKFFLLKCFISFMVKKQYTTFEDVQSMVDICEIKDDILYSDDEYEEELQETNDLKSKIDQDIASASNSPLYQKIKLNNYQQHQNLVQSIDGISNRIFLGKNNINFKMAIQNLVSLIDPQAQQIKEDNIIYSITLLRKIIELKNESSSLDASEWQTEDYQEFLEQIQQIQNDFIEFSVLDKIFQVFCSPQCPESIKKHLLNLMISMLVGGNLVVQNAFYDKFNQDFTNSFIVSITDIINSNYNDAKLSMQRTNKSVQKKVYEMSQIMAANEHDLEVKIFESFLKSNIIDLQKNTTRDYKQYFEENKLLYSHGQRIEIQLPQISELEQANLKILVQIFKLFQCLCEGQHSGLQNHLRSQTCLGVQINNQIDVIKSTITIFHQTSKFLNPYSVKFCRQLMDFCIESIQDQLQPIYKNNIQHEQQIFSCKSGPCKENQLSLCRNRMVENCEDFLKSFVKDEDYKNRGFQSQEEKLEVQEILQKSSHLLYCMIEGEQDQEILKNITENTDINMLLQQLKKCFQQIVQNLNFDIQKLQKQKNWLEIINKKLHGLFDSFYIQSLTIYILVCNLSYDNQNLKKIIDNQENKIQAMAISFFKFHTSQIEVYYQGALVRIFFPRHPACKYLSKDRRVKFNESVGRKSPNDKVMGLLQATPDIINEMNHFDYIGTLPITVTQERFSDWRLLSTMIAFLINSLILYSFQIKSVNNEGFIHIDDTLDFKFIILILGGIQLVTSSVMFLFWLILNANLILSKKWQEHVLNYNNYLQKNHIKPIKFSYSTDISTLTSQETIQLVQQLGPYDSIFLKSGKPDYGNYITKIQVKWLSFKFMMGDGQLLYMIFYIVIAISGVVNDPVSNCIHLFDIITRFQTLQNVIKSVTSNLTILSTTYLFGLTIIYILTILTFYFFDDNQVYFEENRCITLFFCYLEQIQMGLKLGEGMGAALIPMSYQSNNIFRYYFRLFYNMFFFFSINVCFLQIVFNIIVSTFAALRQDRDFMENDMISTCFICGIQNSTFDRYSDGFHNHTERDHNLWNYIYYMYYIKYKDVNEYNGIESFIATQIQESNYSWFPIMKAISVQQQISQETDSQYLDEFKHLKEQLEIIQQKKQEE